MRLILVIPCFNEARRLPVRTFLEFCGIHGDVHFLFVDDGSSDGTADLLSEMQTRDPDHVSCLYFPENLGKGEAVRRGIGAAFEKRPRYIGFWDADLATPLSTIIEFCGILDDRPAVHAVIGSRVKLLGRSIARKLSRHYLGRVFSTTVSFVLGLPVYDTQCGAKLFRASAAVEAIFAKPFLSRWIFDVEILARFIRENREGRIGPLEEVVCEYPLMEWRDMPGSKIRLRHFARAVLDLIGIYCAEILARPRSGGRHGSASVIGTPIQETPATLAPLGLDDAPSSGNESRIP